VQLATLNVQPLFTASVWTWWRHNVTRALLAIVHDHTSWTLLSAGLAFIEGYLVFLLLIFTIYPDYYIQVQQPKHPNNLQISCTSKPISRSPSSLASCVLCSPRLLLVLSLQPCPKGHQDLVSLSAYILNIMLTFSILFTCLSPSQLVPSLYGRRARNLQQAARGHLWLYPTARQFMTIGEQPQRLGKKIVLSCSARK
jgi:hypothetical protein